MSSRCFQISQKTRKYFSRVSVLASKKRSKQKSSTYKKAKIKSSNKWYKVPLFFWFHLFLEARTEILEKNCWFFLEDLKTSKGYFKINWPLVTLVYTRNSVACQQQLLTSLTKIYILCLMNDTTAHVLDHIVLSISNIFSHHGNHIYLKISKQYA